MSYRVRKASVTQDSQKVKKESGGGRSGPISREVTKLGVVRSESARGRDNLVEKEKTFRKGGNGLGGVKLLGESGGSGPKSKRWGGLGPSGKVGVPKNPCQPKAGQKKG